MFLLKIKPCRKIRLIIVEENEINLADTCRRKRNFCFHSKYTRGSKYSLSQVLRCGKFFRSFSRRYTRTKEEEHFAKTCAPSRAIRNHEVFSSFEDKRSALTYSDVYTCTSARCIVARTCTPA